MVFETLTSQERREIARRHLDALESWLRRLIDRQLRERYGPDYFDGNLASGEPLIPRRIRERAEIRLRDEPQRFPRLIDATTLDDVIDIVLHPSLYEEFFRPAIVRVFPEGPPEARTFFGRLVVHRNIVQHVGEISARGAEQCVCYSNDVIYAIRDFFASEGLARQYNVRPLFVSSTIRETPITSHPMHPATWF